MDMISYVLQHLDLYLLVFGRVAGFFLTAVPFSTRNFLLQTKLWLAALVAFLVFMVYPGGSTQVAPGIFGYLLQFGGELLVGMMLGFLTQLVFSIFQFAGLLMDMQIGFGIVNVIDPQYGIQVPVLGNFCNLLALLFFLAINGHHYLLLALTRSYQYLPIGHLRFTGSLASYVLSLGGEMFSSALKIALPVLGALFVANLAMGIIARTVPQMNVFIVGLPLMIGIGLGVLMIMLPMLIWVFQGVFTGLFDDLSRLLTLMGG